MGTLIHGSLLTTSALVLSTKTWQHPTSNGIIVAIVKTLVIKFEGLDIKPLAV